MKHSPYPVILDACVLYPARLRDLLMHLGIAGLYQPKWSMSIHEEWCRSLLKNRPDIEPCALQHTVALMNKALPDAKYSTRLISKRSILTSLFLISLILIELWRLRP